MQKYLIDSATNFIKILEIDNKNQSLLNEKERKNHSEEIHNKSEEFKIERKNLILKINKLECEKIAFEKRELEHSSNQKIYDNEKLKVEFQLR